MAYIIPFYDSDCEAIDITNLKSQHLGTLKYDLNYTQGTIICNDKLYVFK